MQAKGIQRVYAKVLAANDNSKNQVWLGGDLGIVNVIPTESVETVHVKSTSAKPKSAQYIFKAKLRFSWLTDNGELSRSPGAQLILYPQYPEVRFSGFLKGCAGAPSSLMTVRDAGRVMFLGVTGGGDVVGHVVAAGTPAANEVQQRKDLAKVGVLLAIPVLAKDPRSELLAALRAVHGKGWIESQKLIGPGEVAPCRSTNCGGYTLEAELGIMPNGLAEPDYLGWEVKQHGVTSFKRLTGGPITLMTPEPTGGYYKTHGADAFIRKFGYADKKNRPDRFNFGGIHKFKRKCAATELTLELPGYDEARGVIHDPRGGLVLRNDSGEDAAVWSFQGLMQHWQRKHAQAVYVPSLMRKSPTQQYCYGPVVRLGEGTDFHMFLKAVACGSVYYDPGIKLENASTTPKIKKRSQFRVKSSALPALYKTISDEQLV